MNNYLDFQIWKLSKLFLFAFFSLLCKGQNFGTNNINKGWRGCNSITDNDSDEKSVGKDETKFYTNGKMKVEVKKSGNKK